MTTKQRSQAENLAMLLVERDMVLLLKTCVTGNKREEREALADLKQSLKILCETFKGKS
jgi:ABC-type uncharacterized transport system ATPase subunit